MTTRTHPLEPLSAAEIAAAVTAAKAHGPLDDAARFAAVTLVEPSKDELATFAAGGEARRRARLSIVTGPEAALIEASVDVATGEVLRWAVLEDVRPALLFEESLLAIIALHDHPDWVAALARRGITDLEKVQIDPWPTGSFGVAAEDGRRVVRCIAYYREDPASNGYARPIEGLLARVDMARSEVLDVVDLGVVPLPPEPGSYYPEDNEPLRPALAPLHITQPDGPGFTVEGNLVRWERWSLRVSLDPHEGVVLHTVGYDDDGRTRPILHRASICEMVVPYGDPGPMHGWKNAFDAGEWGLGRMANSLTLGCDCLGEIHYLDAVTADEHGNADRRAQRDLHPRGGLRHPLEARRPAHGPERGAPVPSPGDLVDRHRRQLRVRLLLVPLPRRQHPAGGEAHRHHVDPGSGRRHGDARTRRSSPRALPRRCTSTCSAPASTSTWTGRPTRSTRWT